MNRQRLRHVLRLEKVKEQEFLNRAQIIFDLVNKRDMNKKNWLTKRIVLSAALLWSAGSGIGQSTVTFPYTGAPQNWTVPTCVTSITIVAEGAEGGTISGASGGNGAVVTATVAVTPGDVLQLIVGGQPTGAAPGYNGGGVGFNSTDGNPNYGSAGGGGSTNVLINGVTGLQLGEVAEIEV